MSRPVEFTSGGNCSTRSKIRSDASSRPPTAGALGFADNVAPDDERVHAGAEEALDRLFRLADDRLVLVERRIEHHRDAGRALELLDQLPVEWRGAAVDGLQATRAIHVVTAGIRARFAGR